MRFAEWSPNKYLITSITTFKRDCNVIIFKVSMLCFRQSTMDNTHYKIIFCLALMFRGGRYINSLSPHDALKHPFPSLKTHVIFLQLLVIFTHFKSSSSTTSREL